LQPSSPVPLEVGSLYSFLARQNTQSVVAYNLENDQQSTVFANKIFYAIWNKLCNCWKQPRKLRQHMETSNTVAYSLHGLSISWHVKIY